MKKQRHARVEVERGYGPRHAFNAQEGSEAVPSQLPSPPVEEMKFKRDSLGNLRPAMLTRMLGEELGGLSKEDVAKLGISMLVGGEGPLPEGPNLAHLSPHEAAQHFGVGEGAKMSDLSEALNQHLDHIHQAMDEGLPVNAKAAEYYADSSKNWKTVADMLGELGWTKQGDHYVPPSGGSPLPSEVQKSMQAGEPQALSHSEFQAQQDVAGNSAKEIYEKLKADKAAQEAEWAKPKSQSEMFLQSIKGTPDEAQWNAMTPEEQAAHLKWLDEINPAKGKPPEEAPPEGMKKGKAKVGVAKGFGPRHAENAKEGDLTQVNTDTVPAMLTPREAVLNRNAAELAGRGNIEQLNSEGNQLAEKGVDLAARGQASVPPVKVPVPRVSGSGNVMKYVLPGTVRREEAVGLPKLKKGTENMKAKQSKPKPVRTSTSGGGVPPDYGRLPAPPPPQQGGFYPPGMGFAEGTPEVAGIGAPNPSKAYDPREQVDFKAPDLSGFLQAIHAEAKKQGISQTQMADIAKQISGGFGGGGALAQNYAAAGSPTPVYGQSGYPSAIPVGGYQGGISDIGYPPFIMPNAEYHADKGSTWEGAYDPAFLVQRYQGGTGNVPGLQGGNSDYYGNQRFGGGGPSTFAGGGGERFNYDKLLAGGYPGPHLNNPNDPANAPDLPDIGRSQTPLLDQFDTAQANYYRNLGGGFGGFGNTPPTGTPGFLQGPTQHLNYFDAAGYPYAQPVSGDANLIGGHGHGTPPRRPR